jgi:methyl-accepting chemotaxis protein
VRLTLRMKIVGGFLVAVLATLVLGLYAASSFSAFADRSEASARGSEEKVSRIAEIESQFILGNLYASATFNSQSPEGVAAARPQWLENTAQATERFMALRNAGLSPQAMVIYDRLAHDVSWNNKLSNSFMSTHFPVPDESVAIPTIQELMVDGGKAADVTQKALMSGLGELRLQVANDAAAARADVKADADGSLQRLGGLVAVICLGLLAFALGLSYLLVRRLRGTVKALNQVAEGDLTARAPEGGSDEVAEMGAALNSSLNTIHDVVRQIEEDAERLSSLARQQLQPADAVAGHPSGTTVVMANSTRNARELAEMADNLNAMIMVFQTAKDAEPVG